MNKLTNFLQKFYIEYFVLISFFVFFVGFTANYYTLRFTGMTLRVNMLLDFFETRWLGWLFFLLICAGHGLVLWTIIKERTYSAKARMYFLITLGVMTVAFLAKLLFLLINDNYVVYHSQTSWGVTTTENFGFAMLWLLIFMPALITIALVHKGVPGEGEKTLLGHIAKQYNKQDKSS